MLDLCHAFGFGQHWRRVEAHAFKTTEWNSKDLISFFSPFSQNRIQWIDGYFIDLQREICNQFSDYIYT